ncbi:rRNA maturation RNase YbeY [Paenibacillus yanchengensis]|uniref:Endoribonuclease YbeY n=1 Tax=Paenibacillus yanchengensis TaxID=2035833 RepID=A0ABW4YK49_9BACL
MTLTLDWNNEQDKMVITDEHIALLEQLLQCAAQMEAIESGEVTLTFVDDEQIKQLNNEYRGIDAATDVLSFAMQESSEEELAMLADLEGESAEWLGNMLGDIIISTEHVIEQSQQYGHSLERELGFLFVHGFLHLLGYDHQDEQQEAEMFGKQEQVLQQVELVR